ncbi:MAG: YlxR family protein [Pleurocapsa sp.]
MKPNYRRCISCRKIAPKESFWRVVRTYPDNQIAIDWGSGRSAYICPNADCIKQASQKKRLSRALKASVPKNIYQNLQERLVKEC